MADKQPVLLTVLIETESQRWFVGGITEQSDVVPLVCSHKSQLDLDAADPLDERVNFLRHRLSGVLQYGCDRLWGRSMKPKQIVFVCDGHFQDDHPELTQSVADHFVEWMTRPPVAFFVNRSQWNFSGEPGAGLLAGDLSAPDHDVFRSGLPKLVATLNDEDVWEVAPAKTADAGGRKG